MTDQSLPISPTQAMLLASFRRVIKPMVRLFLSKGITYTLLLEEIKRTFVEVADCEFKIDGKAQTDSRLTLITGVHRRDVSRLRQSHASIEPVKNNLSAQIIAQWIGNPNYLTADGKPNPLFLTRKQGEDVSFEALVALVSKDIRSRPVLDEWLRTGIVSINAEGLVQLNQDAFLPNNNLEEQLFFLEMNVHDHLAAAVNNTLSDNKMFERCVYYNGLSSAQVEALHDLIKNQGMDFLKLVNQHALSLEQSPKLENNSKYRINTGLYFYYEPSEDSSNE
jgi:hypothetical protein